MTPKAADVFRQYNAERHRAGLELRERIASIVARYATSHDGRLPSSRHGLRKLKPAINVPAPISRRAIAWHMTQLRRCSMLEPGKLD
jgi:hypothetical protein